MAEDSNSAERAGRQDRAQ